MPFNVSKCCCLHFGHNNNHTSYSLGGDRIENRDSERDLGVTIASSLKVSSRCADAVKKANRALGMIKRKYILETRTQ